MVNFDQILGICLGHPTTMAQLWGALHDDDGGMCDACNKPITKRQMRMEGIASTLREKPVQFHVRCFQFWETESRAPSRSI
jgi:hypothetical protein